jgi:soluble lytic murein transglycosylase-like protein
VILVDALRLCLALAALPDVRPATACTAAVAITIAHEEFDPLLLAAISYQESRFSPAAYNARTGCGGTMGVRRWRGGSALDGYRAGVVVLREASRWCAWRGTPGRMCLLSAYASGPRGPRLGLYKQPRAVLRRLARLRRAMAPTLSTRSGS